MRKTIKIMLVLLCSITLASCGLSNNSIQTQSYENGGYKITIATDDNSSLSQKDMDTITKVLDIRLSSIGILHKTILLDKDEIHIEIPKSNEFDMSVVKPKIISMLVKGKFTVQEVDESNIDSDGNYIPTGKVVFDETQITEAKALEDKMKNNNISLGLNSTAAVNFEKKTEEMIGKPLGIFLDDKLIVAPTVVAKIEGGNLVVSGNLNKEDTLRICSIIKSGALPKNLKIKEVIEK